MLFQQAELSLIRLDLFMLAREGESRFADFLFFD